MLPVLVIWFNDIFVPEERVVELMSMVKPMLPPACVGNVYYLLFLIFLLAYLPMGKFVFEFDTSTHWMRYGWGSAGRWCG